MTTEGFIQIGISLAVMVGGLITFYIKNERQNAEAALTQERRFNDMTKEMQAATAVNQMNYELMKSALSHKDDNIKRLEHSLDELKVDVQELRKDFQIFKNDKHS